MNATAAIAEIGHNKPPVHLLWKEEIDGLFEEATNWCDGEPIASQDQADKVGQLLDMIRTASKDCDKQRAAEKKPHDDAGKAVQALYKPLLDRADIAATACKKALTPWLQKVEDEKRAEAERIRKEAEEKARAAADLAAKTNADSLADQAALEDARNAAQQAQRAAGRADKDRAHVTGGARAVTLRTVYRAELADPIAALKFYKQRQPNELKEWLQLQADKDVRAGSRSIPGFNVIEEKVAV